MYPIVVWLCRKHCCCYTLTTHEMLANDRRADGVSPWLSQALRPESHLRFPSLRVAPSSSTLLPYSSGPRCLDARQLDGVAEESENARFRGIPRASECVPPEIVSAGLHRSFYLFIPYMRLLPSWLWRTKATMAAATKPSAESVMEGHDGGPDSEVRKKAAFESR